MTSAPYDDVDPDRTTDAEPADVVEQIIPVEDAEVEVDAMTEEEESVGNREANPADVVEQSRSLPGDDDDYPRA